MQGHSTVLRQVSAIGAAIALGLVIALAAAGGATGTGGAAMGTLPRDTEVPFWPHETGALAGTSETFVDMRPDGSYYDPSLGRRVRGAARGTRPGDSQVPWPYETAAPSGTSETFVDMRADGSYFDPSLGRRVRGAVDSEAIAPDDRPFYRGASALAPTSLSPDDRPFARNVRDIQPRTVPVEVVRSHGFDWGDGVIGGAFGVALALLGMGSILIAHR